MAVLPASLLLRRQSNYQIDRSLRFNDDDSAYLNRTPGVAGNRKTLTWSGWAKRANIGVNSAIFSADSAATTNDCRIYFSSGDILKIFYHRSAGTDIGYADTTAVFRDSSAWYHIVIAVDTTQVTATDRMKLWVNGTQITSFSSRADAAQNADTSFNNTVPHQIGASTARGFYSDGYMAEIHYIDGTALDPTSFGEDVNGVWRPIEVSGLTYGTCGFYLSFADNTSTPTLGYDDAGSNDWTLNNFSVTAGAGNDSLTDTPTNNYCTLSPIIQGGGFNAANTYANGNLDVATNAGSISAGIASVGMTSSKWYWEILVNSATGSPQLGLCRQQIGTITTNGLGQDATSYVYASNGAKGNNNSFVAYGNTYTTADIISVAYDADTGKVYFAKNGTWQASGDPAAGTNPAYSGLSEVYFAAFGDGGGATTCAYSFNFGQRPFAYTPPTGFSALCTANLPTPDIANPGAYMSAVLYTGTGSSLGVTGAGFQPDLVWIKSRSAATDHALYDAVRGVQKQIESNSTTDETTETTGLTAFGSDGFTVGALAQVNTNTATYVAWCWKEGVTPGFDIVTYTGNGSNRTINHNLGAVPKLIIVKALTTAGTDQGWPVYQAANTAAPETDYLLLNSTAATADDNTLWNDTAPTTTVFSVGTSALVNTNSDTYVAYLFAEVEGFSKFWSYTGNGSADGPFVWTGHRPRWVMIKRTDTVASWHLMDAARSSYNVVINDLFPDSSVVEISSVSLVDFTSNGFKVRDNATASINTAGGTYIFVSFAEQPFSAPSNAR